MNDLLCESRFLISGHLWFLKHYDANSVLNSSVPLMLRVLIDSLTFWNLVINSIQEKFFSIDENQPVICVNMHKLD